MVYFELLQHTLIKDNHKLRYKKGEVPVDKGRYQRLVGAFNLHGSYTNRSQFMHEPYEEHLGAVHCILRYLKGTPRKGLLLKKN